MRHLLFAVAPVLALLLAAPLLAACHTAEGAGQDISAAGQAITNGVEKIAP